MSDEPIRDRDGYQVLTGAFRYAPVDHRWILGGGEEDDESATFYVIVQHPEDPEGRVKRYAVKVPLSVDGHDLIVGNPEVAEL